MNACGPFMGRHPEDDVPPPRRARPTTTHTETGAQAQYRAYCSDASQAGTRAIGWCGRLGLEPQRTLMHCWWKNIIRDSVSYSIGIPTGTSNANADTAKAKARANKRATDIH